MKCLHCSRINAMQELSPGGEVYEDCHEIVWICSECNASMRLRKYYKSRRETTEWFDPEGKVIYK